jgi:hypothetical protein
VTIDGASISVKARPGSANRGEPGHPRRLQRQPAGDQRPFADPVGKGARHRRHDEQGGRPRNQSQTGLERVVTQPRLEELGEEEDGAEQRGEQQQRGGVAR